jgi:hypothetical protein
MGGNSRPPLYGNKVSPRVVATIISMGKHATYKVS